MNILEVGAVLRCAALRYELVAIVLILLSHRRGDEHTDKHDTTKTNHQTCVMSNQIVPNRTHLIMSNLRRPTLIYDSIGTVLCMMFHSSSFNSIVDDNIHF